MRDLHTALVMGGCSQAFESALASNKQFKDMEAEMCLPTMLYYNSGCTGINKAAPSFVLIPYSV